MSVAKHTYELTYIVNAVISDDQVREVVKRVSSYISESGGEIIRVDEWGSQRLAFPIQKKRNGYYVNMYFHASGSLLARLERAMEIDDNILRYLTLRMDAKMMRHFESGKAVVPNREDAGRDKPKTRSSERVAPAKSGVVKAEPVAAEAVAAVVAAAEPGADEPVAAQPEEAPVEIVAEEAVAVEVAPEEVAEVVAAEVVEEVAPEVVAAEVVEEVAPEIVAAEVVEEVAAETVTEETTVEEIVVEETTAEAAPQASADEADPEPETTDADLASEKTKRTEA